MLVPLYMFQLVFTVETCQFTVGHFSGTTGPTLHVVLAERCIWHVLCSLAKGGNEAKTFVSRSLGAFDTQEYFPPFVELLAAHCVQLCRCGS